LQTASNIVCGDAFLIQGQSNAVADGGHPGFKAVRDTFDQYISEWVRTYGAELGRGGDDEKIWGDARISAPGGMLQIGYWGMMLARQLVEDEKMPVCFINGAVGGTRIDQHQRPNVKPTDVPFATIYGRALWRIRNAKLENGIRAVIWHQGEADQGGDAPSGQRGHEYYRKQFFQLAASWQEDMPNIRNYYVFQIWPKACMGTSDHKVDLLREEQRRLVTGISNLNVMSTLGIKPAGSCHYPPEGYAAMADLICPLIQRDTYGRKFNESVDAPNLQKAYYTSAKRDEIALEFGQPMAWNDSLVSEFYPDNEVGQITSGRVDGTRILLKLKESLTKNTLTYLNSENWSQDRMLEGKNGIAALTFADGPVLNQK